MLRQISAGRNDLRHVKNFTGSAVTGTSRLCTALVLPCLRHVSTTRNGPKAATSSKPATSLQTKQAKALLHSGLIALVPLLPPTTTTAAKRRGTKATTISSLASTSSSPFTTPKPRSIHHNSLSSYLTHVARTGASETSTTYLGTRYEYLVLAHLEAALNFQLTRVGGRGDRGVDLIGTWTLPSHSRSQDHKPGHVEEAEEEENKDETVSVVIQTKRLAPTSVSSTAPLPAYLRALEGTLTMGGASRAFSNDTLGILVCTRPATEGLRRAMAASHRGLMYMCVEEFAGEEIVHDEIARGIEAGEQELAQVNKTVEKDKSEVPNTRMVQILWNQAATDIALEGFSVGTRYSADGSSGEAQLLWQGRPNIFTKNDNKTKR